MAQKKIINIDTQNAQKNVSELNQDLQETKNLVNQINGTDVKKVDNNLDVVQGKVKALNNTLQNTGSFSFTKLAGSIGQIGAGISGAFNLVNTAISLMGAESDETTKAIQKLQSFLLLPISFTAITSGISGLKDFVKGIKEVINVAKEARDSIVNDLIKNIQMSQKFAVNQVNAISEYIETLRDKGLETNDILNNVRKGQTKTVREELNTAQGLVDGYQNMIDKIQESWKNAQDNMSTQTALFNTQIRDKITSLKKDAVNSLKFIFNVLKSSNYAVPIAALIALIVSVIKLLKEIDNILKTRVITTLKSLSAAIDTNISALKEFTSFWNNFVKGLSQVNSVKKLKLEIDNLTNSYAAWIKNRRAAIELDRQESRSAAMLIGNVESASRDIDKVIKQIFNDDTYKKTLGEKLKSIFGANLNSLRDLRTYIKDFSKSDFVRINVNDLLGLSNEELVQTEKEAVKNVQKLQEQVAPYIESIKFQLESWEKQQDTTDKYTYNTRKLLLESLKKSFESYYNELTAYQNNFTKAVEGELTARKDIAALKIEEKKNEIGLFKAETEKRKATIKNYELTADYFDRTVAAYNKEITLAKKGSEEEANLKAQLYGFIEGYRKQLEEEFEESMRQTHEWSEEETAEFEKLLAKQSQQIHSFFDTWNQLTGDATEWEPVKMGAKERTAMLELINLTIEANNQFNILIDTVNRFGESSLGLSGSWSNVIADMQLTFNSFALAVSKGGEATFTDWGNAIANVAQMTGAFLNVLSDEQNTQTKEGFEAQKNLQISATVVNMLGGIMNAWTSAMNPANAWLTGAGQIALGTTMSSLIAGIGAAQIAKIAKQQFGGSANVSGNAINSTIIPPVQYSSLVQGAQTEGAIRDTRQYVSVVEIDKVQKRVNITENESRY